MNTVMGIADWKGIFRDPDRKKGYLEYLDEWEARICSLLEREEHFDGAIPDGPLSGVPFAVKDNIAAEGFRLSCGSKMLEHFTCPYNATVIDRLKKAGALVAGKCNLDEFGMGSSTDNSALAVTNNPWNTAYVAGGSSGGSAAAVAAGIVPFALGSDTGGSVRQPAAFCGVYGLKPTYGAVSRYGLVAYASSLEVVGLLGESVDMVRQVFDIIKGRDERDQSSVDCPGIPESGGGTPQIPAPSDTAKRIGILKNLSGLSPALAAAYKETIASLEKNGCTVAGIDLPALDYAVASYYTIATAEASANLARYTGIRYGFRSGDSDSMEEMVRETRTRGFGDEVKLRILLGTYVLRSGFQDQYYGKAQKVRTAIRNDFHRVFGEVDLILMPVYPVQAFLHGDKTLDQFRQKLADKFTVAANLAGIPAMSFPVGVTGGLPLGMQFLGPEFSEHRIFQAAEEFSVRMFGSEGIPRPRGYRRI